ncbi:MAG: hypothetical protein HYU59_02205 [Magnetospirillum gryphiswaldense]|uniref:hypothetical protein n=1 Tax=Magnetospirillum sp. 64-120 TaxID=1895778 RepID=UPI0025BE3173|nr:hypothetical protein [Magnetospirillum sp. 64-120]MBI2239597.1 hypothetical protein [Magnetospirillum gryphiswaldense]
MKDSQITALFMAVGIVVTAFALHRNRALGRKALLLVLASTLVVAGFIFVTLGD